MSQGTIIACTWGPSLHSHQEVGELLTFAAQAGRALNAQGRWLALGAWGEEGIRLAREHGLGALDELIEPAEPGPDASVEVLARYSEETAPLLILFPSTTWARIVAPRLAARLGVGVLANVLEVRPGEERLKAVAAMYGGAILGTFSLVGPTPHLLVLSPTAVVPRPQPAQGEVAVRQLAYRLDEVRERARCVSRSSMEGPRLEDAPVIVAGGRGLGSPDNYRLVEELARALGGAPAASRPLVDEGWVDASRQVGLTGKVVRPLLYVAVGISGASQHMAGCSAARVIVAINKDPDAPIFRYAKYGIVGDCLELIPAILRALPERQS